MSEIRDKCKVCNSNTTIISHPKFGDYYYCENCEFIAKRDLNKLDKGEKLRYCKHNNSIENKGYVDYLYKFIEVAVLPYVGDGRQGLDFGSGPSPVLAMLLEKKQNFRMDIYDYFFSPIKIYIGKKYDLVTSTEVVEHLNDPLQYFDLFSRLLKSNGILVLMTQFHKNDKDHFFKWPYIRDKSHVSFYTLKTMEYIAAKVGLKIIYTDNEKYLSLNKI
jgi:hypothetical protein